MARRLISAAASLGVGGTAAITARRPSLMEWPRGVRPAVVSAAGVGACVGAWFIVDTVVTAPHRPGALLRRPVTAVFAVLAAVAVVRVARAVVTPRLEASGRARDKGFIAPPDSSLVSGGPDSVVDYATVGREGARFVHTTAPADAIEAVMGAAPQTEPIRIFIGVDAAASPEERVALAIAELRRTRAFDRTTVLVESPAGSGFANPTPADVLEIALRGDCATVAVGYGLLPSFLSLDRVPRAALTQQLLLQAVMAEIRALPAQSRPRVLLYGESLGARVQQAAIDPSQLSAMGVSSALWVGTPGGKGADAFRAALVDAPVIVDNPQQLPVPLPMPHPMVWFLEHDGDPVVRFRRDLLHRRPAWLSDEPRGRNIPDTMSWVPGVTWLQVLVDTLFATQVRPGDFDSRGHDYRADLGAVVCAAFDLTLPEGGADRLEATLRALEVARAARIDGATP